MVDWQAIDHRVRQLSSPCVETPLNNGVGECFMCGRDYIGACEGTLNQITARDWCMTYLRERERLRG